MEELWREERNYKNKASKKPTIKNKSEAVNKMQTTQMHGKAQCKNCEIS